MLLKLKIFDKRLAIRWALPAVCLFSIAACTSPQELTSSMSNSDPIQAELGSMSVVYLQQEGLQFKDLNKDSELNLYEDWRLAPADRAADLIARMTLEEKAGTLLPAACLFLVQIIMISNMPVSLFWKTISVA